MLDNFKMWWNDAANSTKIGFGIGVFCILGLLVGGIYWVFHDDYQVLFTDLNPQDASAMVSELEKAKTPYRLENDGASIFVPKDIVYKTRLKLMGQNVTLHGGVGFEIFNTSDFGMTEFAQKVNYQRALQGELSRTIMAFDEVKHARVHLVMTDSGLFKKNKVKPKASVTLIMKPDASLKPEQVAGIQRLIAASVPEIETTGVTILGHQGIALSKNPKSDNDAAGNQYDMADNLAQQLEVKKLAENHLSKKLNDVLEKALGANQAIISVDISLNYDQVKVTQENVLGADNKTGEATGIIVRKRQSQNSQSMQPNDLPAQAAESKRSSAASSSGNTNMEIDYQTGRRIEQIVSTPGSVRRISIGVLVPNAHSEEKLRTIKEIVEMTAGIDPERGDAVAVYSIDKSVGSSRGAETLPVAPSISNSEPNMSPSASLDTSMRKPVLADYIKMIGLILLALILIALAHAAYRRRFNQQSRPLNVAEREQMLREMRGWLATDFTEPNKGSAP